MIDDHKEKYLQENHITEILFWLSYQKLFKTFRSSKNYKKNGKFAFVNSKTY